MIQVYDGDGIESHDLPEPLHGYQSLRIARDLLLGAYRDDEYSMALPHLLTRILAREASEQEMDHAIVLFTKILADSVSVYLYGAGLLRNACDGVRWAKRQARAWY